MLLHLDGASKVNSTRERAFSFLTDPAFLARTLPDAEDVRVVDGDSLEAKLKLRIAVVSSTLKMKMTVGERTPPSSATMTAEGAGSGSSIKITSLFRLEGDAPTTISWSADAEITGVMAGLGSTLLRGFAAKKVAEIFQSVTLALESAQGKQEVS
jgi:uncharacterized protein